MKTNKKIAVIILIVVFYASHVNAKLAQPDFILYGTATWFGEPLANGAEITIYLENQLLTVAKYSMGTDNNLLGLYALRIPMDDVDPRQHGKSRPGDPATVYINGNLVAEVVVGDYGTTDKLDLDPINTIGSAAVLSISPAQIAEGNTASSFLTMDINLSDTSNNEISVNWTTLDATALGQENCAFDVDYVNANGVATIPALSTSTTIQIEICGDTIIENNETFEVILSQANNAIIQFDRTSATILDDDGAPELRGFDIVVFEPDTGVIVKNFEFSLSRAYEQEVTFNYTTVADTATAGSDFMTASGQVTIPAGQTHAVVAVNFLSDNITESIEILHLTISNVLNAQIVDSTFTAFILDADREQQTQQDNSITNMQVPDLISPSSVVFGNANQHVYVASLTGNGKLMHFTFNNGTLNFVSTIDNSVVGFETAKISLIRQIILSADGNFLYTASSGDSSISAFSIDNISKELSFIASYSETTPGEFGITGLYGLSISPDGKHLYAAGSNADSVASFGINLTTGELSFIEKETLDIDDPNDSGGTVTFMDRPVNLTVSPDGANLYVSAEFSSAVVVFNRDATTGMLNYVQSLKSGVAGVSDLGGTTSLKTSLNGSHVYALGRTENSVVIFNRAVNGNLTFNKSLTKVQPDFIGLDSPIGLVINPNNNRLYAIGFDDSSMVTFNRNNDSVSSAFGDLEFADIEQDGIDNVNTMNGPTSLDISSDGKWIIVAAGIDNALTIFFTPLEEFIFSNGFE